MNVFVSIGLSNDEINNMLDARFIKAAHELHTLREQVKGHETKQKAQDKVKSRIKIRPAKQKTGVATKTNTSTKEIDLNASISKMRNASSSHEHDKAAMSILDKLFDQ